jgi:hypothetical protein
MELGSFGFALDGSFRFLPGCVRERRVPLGLRIAVVFSEPLPAFAVNHPGRAEGGLIVFRNSKQRDIFNCSSAGNSCQEYRVLRVWAWGEAATLLCPETVRTLHWPFTAPQFISGGLPVFYKLGLVVILASILLGCSASAHLYPVQGPLSTQTPMPTLDAKVSPGRHASVVMPDGEVCTGRWEYVEPKKKKGDNTAKVETPSDLAAAWDAVYGPGYYVSHVLGEALYYRAVLTGNRGSTLKIETYTHSGDSGEVRGVAIDGKGNTFKVGR